MVATMMITEGGQRRDRNWNFEIENVLLNVYVVSPEERIEKKNKTSLIWCCVSTRTMDRTIDFTNNEKPERIIMNNISVVFTCW